MKPSYMKRALFRKLLSTAGALMCFTIVTPVSAGPPDFSVCYGLSGAGWGLCRAGVAAGCADGTGDPASCENIEDQYLQVTGNLSPWIEPPATCPCDFNVLPKTSPPWSGTLEEPIEFICDLGLSAGFYTNDEMPLTSIFVSTTGYVPPGEFSGYYCNIIENDSWLIEVEILTTEVFDACFQDVIKYGQAFKALNPEIPIDDKCTPKL
jgi:hypothetical protein